MNQQVIKFRRVAASSLPSSIARVCTSFLLFVFSIGPVETEGFDAETTGATMLFKPST